MFKIYDLNYNEVEPPLDLLGYGMKGLNIHIGPVIHESIFSESNFTDTLVKRYAVDRNASIEILFTSKDTTDWRLKRDRIYQFFRQLGVFYVAEKHQPFKLLKVMVDESYEFESEIITWGESEITLKVLDTPFKQSLHTTQDLDNEGLNFNDKWAYGMGLSADSTQWQYSFSNVNPSFYNASTEEVKLIRQKESEITLTVQSVPRNDLIDIDDGDTTFKIWKEFDIGDVIKISGHTITLNGSNVLGDTNAEFLTVKPGWNDWDIRGLPSYDFNIDFRFLYD